MTYVIKNLGGHYVSGVMPFVGVAVSSHKSEAKNFKTKGAAEHYIANHIGFHKGYKAIKK